MEQGYPFTLVQLAEVGEPRTTMPIITSHYGVSYASFIKLVRKCPFELVSFGEVRFEIRLNNQDSSTE